MPLVEVSRHHSLAQYGKEFLHADATEQFGEAEKFCRDHGHKSKKGLALARMHGDPWEVAFSYVALVGA